MRLVSTALPNLLPKTFSQQIKPPFQHQSLNQWNTVRSPFLSKAEMSRLGVNIISPENTLIGRTVKLSPGVTIYPFSMLLGNVEIETGGTIGPGTCLLSEPNHPKQKIQIKEGANVILSFLERNATVGKGSKVGPFTYLRDGAQLSPYSLIGAFVEAKNLNLGSYSSIPHLSMIGNTTVGEHVNIGGGTITSNYDPVRKKRQSIVINDKAMTGAGAILQGNTKYPLTIGKNALVASGTVAYQNVPADSLAIGRPEQTTLPNWVSSRSVTQSK